MRKQFIKAQALARSSKYKKALSSFRRALMKAQGPGEQIECHMAIADTCRMTGDFEDSVVHYKKAISLMPRNAPERTDASVGLALANRALGYHAEAIKALDKAVSYYGKRDDREGLAFATWARAGALRVKGDIPGALKQFRDARGMFKALGDWPAVGYSLCGMGGASRVKGDFGKSLEYYREANELFASLKDTFGTAYSHCGIGNALRMEGDHERARNHFVRASELYQRIGDIVSFSYTLWSLGKTHMITGNLPLAEKYFKDAQRNFRKTRDPRGLIYCRLAIGESKLMLGSSAQRRAEARRYFTDAMDMAARWKFGIELCHSEALMSFLDEGRTDNSCYRALGLRLSFVSVPFNIP
jgi:tetratricopeptide (TPR) repeat protein